MTLNEAIESLKKAGIENPEFDARELFMHFGKLKMHELVSRSAALEDEIIAEAIRKRAERVPLQYIIGHVGFYRESYKVSPACLIPRQDTEILVDYAVKNIPDGEEFLDICTGSGCIAISTLKNTKNTSCSAIDVSEAALAVAEENAKENGVSARIKFLKTDALTFIPKKKVFAVLSNPPYVTDEEYEKLDAELYHEPKIALVGADRGLAFYKKITSLTKGSLKPNGFIAFEIGKDQAEALRKIAKENLMNAEIIKDLSGNARVAVLKTVK
ncbi:MAG: peptide chain release factor N(5)-glutamine methyltransferase [Clostridia bacterium]|nr:peptide chain release factor N(5)-glutamine methyltransferase [Clostridia bacterium]